MIRFQIRPVSAVMAIAFSLCLPVLGAPSLFEDEDPAKEDPLNRDFRQTLTL